MHRFLLVFAFLAATALAEDEQLLQREQSLLAKLANFPEQPLVPLPADSSLPFTEYFRYEDRLYRKVYVEGDDGKAYVAKYLCTNENLDTWQDFEPVAEYLKKIQDYVAGERMKARIEIQNHRNQILLQLASLQRQQQRQHEETLAKTSASTATTVYDSQGRPLQSIVTTPNP